MNVILRERLQEVAQCFHEIEVALFSTFTYSADFFEQNVLPALFDVESTAILAARDAVVHRRLKQTAVGVFYDPSVARSSGKAYRYTHYPVFLDGRLFHSKNILLIGRDHQGRRWLYLAAMSANLTLSGWGRNREGFADTWIHAQSEQPWQATRDMLLWLKNKIRIPRKDHPLDRALSLLEKMQSNCSAEDPDGVGHAAKKAVRFYFSPSSISMWDFMRHHYGKLTSVKAASPYWGGCARIRETLGADLPLQAVAAHLPPAFEKTGLGKEGSYALYPADTEDQVSTWDDHSGRFSHVKLYKVETAKGPVLGIGSCNFTSRGQFWKAADEKEKGNVESMLFDVCAISWPATRPLAVHDLGERNVDEEAEIPRPWPFYVAVTYDWKKQRYAWRLEGKVTLQSATLTIKCLGKEIEISDARPGGELPGELCSSIFQVRHGSETYVGLITELNLDHSIRTYGTPLGLAAILQSWSNGAIVEPLPPTNDDDDSTQQPEPGGDGEDDEDNGQGGGRGAAKAPAFFDFFAFFQATRLLRQRLADLGGRNGKGAQAAQVLDLLVVRSDSVEALASCAEAAKLSPSSELVVLTECVRLLGGFLHIPQAVIARQRICDRLHHVRCAVLDAIRQELSDRGLLSAANADYPERMLKWYEKKLNLEFDDHG